MIYDRTGLHEAFKLIKERSRNPACSTLIFVSNECDSICALHILVNLLQADCIPHQIIPVSGYDDLFANKVDMSITSLEFATVIMLNCGGSIDIVDEFKREAEYDHSDDSIKFVVLDSHRPYNLANVLILDDCYEYKKDLFPHDADDSDVESNDGSVADSGFDDDYPENNEAEENDSEDSISGDIDTNHEEGAVEDVIEHEEINSRENEVGEEFEAELNSEDDEEPSRKFHGDSESDLEVEKPDVTVKSDKRKKTPTVVEKPVQKKKRRLTKISASEREAIRQKRRENKEILNAYYNTSFYGTSIALLAYELSDQLNKQSNFCLWLGILGLTDQYVMERIPFQRYLEAAHLFEAQVMRFNPIIEDNSDAPFDQVSAENENHVSANVRHGHISYELDYQCLLMRHWTLFDSLLHSRYVCTRLHLWQSGSDHLKHLLAKMGVQLIDAQCKYSLMDSNVKKELRKKFTANAPAFDLHHIVFESFVRRHGDLLDMSASDMVHSITALIESSKGFDIANISDNDEENATRYYENMKMKFWIAYYAIGRDEVQTLLTGVREAISLQQAILRQGRSILDKKDFNSVGLFRYAILKANVDSETFSNPTALTKLAFFLMDAVLESNTEAKVKPFVICAPNEKRRTYVVIGVAPGFQTSHGIEDIYHNGFGVAFRTAAEKTDTRFKHDGFDSSMIEIQQGDLGNFLEMLHSGLVEISM